MALIDDHQIKKVGRELLVNILIFGRTGDGLIETQVDLVRFVDGSVGDFGHRLAEGFEIVRLGLIGQDVAIDQEQDPFLRASFPKSPDDLECRVGLASARGHDQQDAIVAACDRIDGPIDRDALVVSGRFLGAVVVVILGHDRFLPVAEPFGGAVAIPKLVWGWEMLERNFTCDARARGGPIVFQERVAVAAVGERNIEDFGVFEGLLHPCTDRVRVVFGFDDRDRKVRFVEEQVVGLFRFPALDGFASDNHSAFGEVGFFANLGHQVPFFLALAEDGWRDELGADVGLAELFFVHRGISVRAESPRLLAAVCSGWSVV